MTSLDALRRPELPLRHGTRPVRTRARISSGLPGQASTVRFRPQGNPPDIPGNCRHKQRPYVVISLVDERMANENCSLLGGPLHRLGRRLGLVRGTNTVRLGLALGFVPWAVLMLLATIEGAGREVALALPHRRACPPARRHAALLHLRDMARSAAGAFCPRYRGRRCGARGHCAGAAVRNRTDGPVEGLLAGGGGFRGPGGFLSVDRAASAVPWRDGRTRPGRVGTAILAGSWYWTVCLPLFRFLMFRWIWRLLLWWRFLWKVSRLDLHLVPTHPDNATGLGYLEIVHAHFIPLVLAVSAVISPLSPRISLRAG